MPGGRFGGRIRCLPARLARRIGTRGPSESIRTIESCNGQLRKGLAPGEGAVTTAAFAASPRDCYRPSFAVASISTSMYGATILANTSVLVGRAA
jgi:hypothetical protein